MTVAPTPLPPLPVRVGGHLESPSRWLWLVKWLLALPHYIVLALLWLGSVPLTIAAFVALLFTGRYPRPIFDYNLAVLRWSWRVGFYAYGANGTDRYPPFTFGEAPDYPARLDIAYPQWQRKGFSLIGWWLAGIPQYIVVGILLGSAGSTAWWIGGDAGDAGAAAGWFGLIGVLVLTAAIVLLFRGYYPRSIFDLVLGLNRWVLRTAAFAMLMTPDYPPFRVDAGEAEPGAPLTLPAPEAAAAPGAAAPAPAGPWTGGRVTALVLSTLALLVALGLLTGGAVTLAIDQTQRDDANYVMTDAEFLETTTYALVSEDYRTGAAGDVIAADDVLGTVRVRAVSADPVFVGIGPADEVDAYLAGVQREEVDRFEHHRSDFRLREGGAPATPPADQTFWAATATGAGTQSVDWKIRDGDWRIVLMNADGASAVAADVSVGARFPSLLDISLALIGGALVLIAIGAFGAYASIPKATRSV